MQHSEEQLVMALDLFKAGIDQDTHLLLTAAHNLISMGYTKGVYWENQKIEAAIEAVSGNDAATDIHEGDAAPLPKWPPDPDLRSRYYPSTQAKEQRNGSTRQPTAGGVQWGSEYVDHNNITPPKDTLERAWSGWALNYNQLSIMKMFTGENGRYTLGVSKVISFIKKYGKVKPGQDPSARKHIKPHYLMNSLSRRGLVMEIDNDVWILSPRGVMFVREYLKLEPTPRHDSVDTVKAGE